ncbi:fibronectin type III domain-containing protein [Mesonia ostreae]|uniref:Fibronectin type III domain-containing protein n=1 Tax=Mesonia ostreae TaxID=861110 RepID=A0ABU2KFH5_9FLAO|nr:fibronectin type III domain-containing protein [Mesonia ostreae]MDT0293445.1 fibronectin type III domain-containing protein [Mesonia ostreae]
MNFFSKSIIIIVCCLGIYACSNDDNGSVVNDDTTTIEPSKLEISDITFTSAQINWTVNTIEKLEGTPYSLYLNDSLLSNQIFENSYLLEDLSASTSYTVVLEYDNVNNLTSSLQKEFETSSSGNLVLSKYIFNHNNSSNDTIELEYNTNEQLVRREFLAVPAIFRKGYEYFYNEQNNLKEVQELNSFTRANIFFDSNGEFNDIKIREGDSDVFNKYEFSDFTDDSYNLSKTLINTFGGDYSEELIYEKAINFIMNNNRLTNVIETNLETQETIVMAFTYSAGNLVEIKLDEETLVISYDDKKNLHTYSSFLLGGSMYSFLDCGGLLYLEEQFQDKIKYYPHFNHQNENNPIEYKLNGIVVKTFAYDYNEFNYPSKIYVNSNTSEEIDINLEYNPSLL